jgi:hypothetical protein
MEWLHLPTLRWRGRIERPGWARGGAFSLSRPTDDWVDHGRMSDLMKFMPVRSLILLLALPVFAGDVSTTANGVRIRAGALERTIGFVGGNLTTTGLAVNGRELLV